MKDDHLSFIWMKDEHLSSIWMKDKRITVHADYNMIFSHPVLSIKSDLVIQRTSLNKIKHTHTTYRSTNFGLSVLPIPRSTRLAVAHGKKTELHCLAVL